MCHAAQRNATQPTHDTHTGCGLLDANSDHRGPGLQAGAGGYRVSPPGAEAGGDLRAARRRCDGCWLLLTDSPVVVVVDAVGVVGVVIAAAAVAASVVVIVTGMCVFERGIRLPGVYLGPQKSL